MAIAVEVEPPKWEPGKATTPPGEGKIQCPKCHWKPSESDRWACTCEHSWNTFETHGRCPGCGKQWTQTQCLHCGDWSPHEDWYVDDIAGFSA